MQKVNLKQRIHVKVGDLVKVISGKDRGKTGKILQVLHKKSQVVVDGINIKTKHQKSTQEGEAGTILKKETPIHSSNVMLYSTKYDLASRIFYKKLDNGKKARCLVKNKEIIN
uniref:Large ribosomal subunit protein uL24c n=1 Tax=Bangiopsis subsimplex TaxID=139980 RepID=A0A1C9CD11_9RHOD|nr:ribosomal protein L24 [Bangiopsis subsimplex]AOM66265.1 ribosomal protein L24 [Bangiopsis subsimplex]ARO90373.1 50S ribosomal protein L24 [Bangiopsis subsimplex]